MQLIGRYLRAFTIHTQYNIRDWGASYLDSPEATDLAGRAERDCGVYAFTVAYEVYRTARSARPRLDLVFQLVALPEHVALGEIEKENVFATTTGRKALGAGRTSRTTG